MANLKDIVNQSNLYELKSLVESCEIDVHATDDSGSNILMHAAIDIGNNEILNVQSFNYIFHQKVQPLSIEEKIMGLELLGSSFILRQDFTNGVDCWMRAFLLNNSLPRSRLIESSLPPVFHAILTTKGIWTNLDDLAQLDKKKNTIPGKCTLFNQAIALRHSILNKSSSQEVVYLLDFLEQQCYSTEPLTPHTYLTLIGYPYRDLTENPTLISRLYLTLLLFAWDEHYDSVLISHHSYRARELFRNVVVDIGASGFQERRQNLVKFNSTMIILKWLVKGLEKAKIDGLLTDTSEARKAFDDYFVLRDILLLVSALLKNVPLTKRQTSELLGCLRRLIAIDLRETCDGYDLLLIACREMQSTKLHEQIIPLLIKAGANVNSCTLKRNNGLHILINNGRVISLPTFHLLLQSGTHWDAVNDLGRTPLDIIKLGSNGANENEIDLGFFRYGSLQCLCARIVQRNKDKIDCQWLPPPLVQFINMH